MYIALMCSKLYIVVYGMEDWGEGGSIENTKSVVGRWKKNLNKKQKGKMDNGKWQNYNALLMH